MTYAVLGGWACICLFPLYWAAATSLKGPLEIVTGPVYVPFVDYSPSLDAWTYILFDSDDAPLLRYLNSAVVALTSTALTMFLGGLAVYGLTRFRHAVSWLTIGLALTGVGLAAGAYVAGSTPIRLAFVLATALPLLAAVPARRDRGPVLRNTGILVAMLASRILPPVVIVLPTYLMAQQTGTSTRASP
jgi:multiple sugar transport system permease protein